MKVIAHQPWQWFLLKDNDSYNFDVNVDIRPATFSVTFLLNEQEIEDYLKVGNEFLDNLALLVHKSFVMQTSINFTNRFINDKDLTNSITQAVKEWQKQNS